MEIARRNCSVHLFVKPLMEIAHGNCSWELLMEIAGIFVHCFVILVIVFLDFSVLSRKITHENPVNLLHGLGKWLQWEPDTFKNADPRLSLDLSHSPHYNV